MSEDIKPEEGNGKEETEQPKPVLMISLDKQGHVQISGIIDNKVMTIYLLDEAKEIVREYHRKKNQSKIVQPNFMGNVRNFLNKR